MGHFTSTETRLKISKANKNRKLTPEVIKQRTATRRVYGYIHKPTVNVVSACDLPNIL